MLYNIGSTTQIDNSTKYCCNDYCCELAEYTNGKDYVCSECNDLVLYKENGGITPYSYEIASLLRDLRNYSGLIIGMEVPCGCGLAAYIIKYDWTRYSQGYVLYSLGEKENIICSGSNKFLFEKLLEEVGELSKFNIIVRNKILPHPKYSDRKISGDAPILEIDNYMVTEGAIRDRHFAVSKFTYSKIKN